MVNLTIDGRAIQAKKGSTILDVARENGIFIPTLCYHQALHPIGSCRICVVEVKPGPPRPLPACATYVNEGMEVITNTPKLEAIRDELMKLVLINHALECPICDKGGECELQNLTHALGVPTVDLDAVKLSPQSGLRLPDFVERHPDRCVTCGRCVRICRDRVGAMVLNFTLRGYFTELSSGELPLNCEFCGSCIDICPVGALINKQFKYRARAWEVAKTEIACPFCGGGCTYRCTPKTARSCGCCNEKTVLLCGRGRFGWPVVEAPDRLKTPLIKENGKFREASWDEALDLVAAKFKETWRPTAPRPFTAWARPGPPTKPTTCSRNSSGPGWAPTRWTTRARLQLRPGLQGHGRRFRPHHGYGCGDRPGPAGRLSVALQPQRKRPPAAASPVGAREAGRPAQGRYGPGCGHRRHPGTAAPGLEAPRKPRRKRTSGWWWPIPARPSSTATPACPCVTSPAASVS